jgi:hypothetical protein
MSFQISKTVPLPVLRDKLKAVVSERGSIYQMISAIILTFEDDDSGAQEDAVTLGNCSRDVFGITDITKLLFERGDKTPAWALMDVLRGAITRIGDTRSLWLHRPCHRSPEARIRKVEYSVGTAS